MLYLGEAPNWSASAQGGLVTALVLTVVAGLGWLVRYFITRRDTRSEQSKKEDAAVAVAAMGWGKDIIAAYAQEVRALRMELQLSEERHGAAIRQCRREVERYATATSQLHRLYYRAIEHIEFMERHIRQTDPDWPSHTLPKELTDDMAKKQSVGDS